MITMPGGSTLVGEEPSIAKLDLPAIVHDCVLHTDEFRQITQMARH
jgi:hypothetical protein